MADLMNIAGGAVNYLLGKYTENNNAIINLAMFTDTASHRIPQSVTANFEPCI